MTTGAAAQAPEAGRRGQAPQPAPGPPATASISYPRVFRGRQLATIAFPTAAASARASVSLGGRGQPPRLGRFFNRPGQRQRPEATAFPCIWAQAGSGKPVARVLEARILPAYDGRPDGLTAHRTAAPG